MLVEDESTTANLEATRLAITEKEAQFQQQTDIVVENTQHLPNQHLWHRDKPKICSRWHYTTALSKAYDSYDICYRYEISSARYVPRILRKHDDGEQNFA